MNSEVDATLAVVASHFDITVKAMRNPRNRTGDYVDARAVAAWLLVTMHRTSLRETACILGYAKQDGSSTDVPELMNRVTEDGRLGDAALSIWWERNADVYATAEKIGL